MFLDLKEFYRNRLINIHDETFISVKDYDYFKLTVEFKIQRILY